MQRGEMLTHTRVFVLTVIFQSVIILFLLVSKNKPDNFEIKRNSSEPSSIQSLVDIPTLETELKREYSQPMYWNGQEKLRIVSVLGTRPEVIKFAMFLKEMKKYEEIESILISTGQQREMVIQQLQVFDLDPDIDLNMMIPNQTLEWVTAEATLLLGKINRIINPHLVVVQGDTTTAMVASLAAFYCKIPVAHIEAGLRTMNIYSPFPEEMNRKVIDILSYYRLAPSWLSAQRLLQEGIPMNRIFITGNPGIDSLLWILNNRSVSQKLKNLLHKIQFPYYEDQEEEEKNRKGNKIELVLVTTHRRENFPVLEGVCKAIKEIAENHSKTIKILFPVHLNPNVRKVVYRILDNISNVYLEEPLDYEELVHIIKISKMIISDSGGIQEEAVALGKPLILIRKDTERLEGVINGSVRIVGTNPLNIISMSNLLLSNKSFYDSIAIPSFPFGNGTASSQIVNIILDSKQHLLSREWIISQEFSYALEQQDFILSSYGFVNATHNNIP